MYVIASAYSCDLLSVLVRNCDAEFLLELHDGSTVSRESAPRSLLNSVCGSNFVFIYCEFVNDDSFYS